MEGVDFTDQALADLEHWKKSGNAIVLKRIKLLIAAIEVDPFHGIGKPEALKHNFAGYWSRRIDHEHRIVYKIETNAVKIYSLRYHYIR